MIEHSNPYKRGDDYRHPYRRDGEVPFAPSDGSAELPDDFDVRVARMGVEELRSRVLCQRDYLRRFYQCLDGLEIPADISRGVEKCRDHHTIRGIVEALLSRLPNVV